MAKKSILTRTLQPVVLRVHLLPWSQEPILANQSFGAQIQFRATLCHGVTPVTQSAHPQEADRCKRNWILLIWAHLKCLLSLAILGGTEWQVYNWLFTTITCTSPFRQQYRTRYLIVSPFFGWTKQWPRKHALALRCVVWYSDDVQQRTSTWVFNTKSLSSNYGKWGDPLTAFELKKNEKVSQAKFRKLDGHVCSVLSVPVTVYPLKRK